MEKVSVCSSKFVTRGAIFWGVWKRDPFGAPKGGVIKAKLGGDGGVRFRMRTSGAGSFGRDLKKVVNKGDIKRDTPG